MVITFLKENWIWILAPVAVMLVLLAYGALAGGGDTAAPFEYALF